MKGTSHLLCEVLANGKQKQTRSLVSEGLLARGRDGTPKCKTVSTDTRGTWHYESKQVVI